MGQTGIVVDEDRALKSFLRLRSIIYDYVEPRQAQIRLNPPRVQLNGMIDFSERLLSFVSRIENAAHQYVAFDVIGILLQNFLRQSLSFSN